MADDSRKNPRGPDAAAETLRAAGPPEPAELADSFPQLELIELLGQGGMGWVYKARQRDLDRLVALKLLPREVAGEPNFAERFAREARALARLSHPGIVMVHDSGRADGLFYFIMEYVEGLNLRELLLRESRLEPDRALGITSAVCDALDYAHEEGVIHRDIKPENLLLDARGRVKIADFGVARLVRGDAGEHESLTLQSPHRVLGTPHYMAPEQVRRPLDVDHRADLYAVGVVLYEMLTGELPLGRFALPSELGRGGGEIDGLVARALEVNPQRRFQRAAEIRAAADAARGGGAPLAVAATPPPAAVGEAPVEATGRTPSPSAAVDLFRAAQRVRWPADLMIAAAVGALLAANPLGIVTLLGAIRMRRLEARSLAVAGSICALLPLSICWLPLGLIGGAWGWWILTRPEIVAAFDTVAAATRASRPR